MQEDVSNTILSIKRTSEFRATIRIHTSLMPWVLLILFGVTLMQSLDVWKGDMWKFHHDFVSPDLHQWAIELSETLGEEHLLTGYHKANPQLEGDHPHHHSNIEKEVSSHWQNAVLTWVIHLNMSLILTFLLRYYFFFKRQTHVAMSVILWILLVSAIFQVVALSMRGWVCLTYTNFWSVMGLAANGLLLLMEMASMQDIYEIRRLTMFLATVMRNVKIDQNNSEQEFVGQNRSSSSSKRKTISSPISWMDSATTFLVNLGDNISLYRANHEKFD